MKRMFSSWLFFTALMLALFAASLTLPELSDKVFGATRQQIVQTAHHITQEAQTVWANWDS